MSKRKIDELSKLFSILTILLLVVFLFGFILKFTGGGKESFKTVYIEYKSEKITTEHSQIALPLNKTSRFDIKNTFGDLTEIPKYSVKIIFNSDNEALKSSNFLIGDKLWNKTDEITKAFTINIQPSYFTITTIKPELTETAFLNLVIDKVFSGQQCFNMPNENDLPIKDRDFYRIVVSFENFTYNIDFYFGLYNVVLNPSEVIF